MVSDATLEVPPEKRKEIEEGWEKTIQAHLAEGFSIEEPGNPHITYCLTDGPRRRVYVVGYTTDNSGGFDWFPEAAEADAHYEEWLKVDKNISETTPNDFNMTMRYDCLVDRLLQDEDDVTEQIDENLINIEADQEARHRIIHPRHLDE